MPRKPIKSKIKKTPIPEGLRHYLETGEIGMDVDAFLVAGSETMLRQTRQIFGEGILDEWIKSHPGTRPAAWWRLEAPEPRQRIGGTGRTLTEKYPAILPSFDHGIPAMGQIVKSDPPTFESQATYLKRRCILTDAEKKYLAKHPELIEPEVMDID